MDPPLVPPFSTTQYNYPDSTDSNSSPRRPTETWDEPLPPVPGAKLRLMCSYGGHIIPRPHDKSLCYVGGDTRMVVVDRHSSLSDLSSHLSRTLLNGHQFTLKYQLPNEDLDSLISVTTDEDLENMIEEHDRTTSAKSRLRLFLFLPKPESSTSMGSLLDDAKSETWFVDALNGSGFLPRRLSDSAAIDRLFGLDGVDGVIGNINNGSSNDLEAQATETEHGKQVKDVHSNSMPESPTPMVENTSSFGSTSSSHSMSNLPPIRIRVEEPLPQITVAPLASGVMANYNGVSSENTTKAFSADERSEHGRPVRLRKPPLPLQPVQHKTGGYNLTSPDSVASDSSIASSNSLSRHVFGQEQAPPTARDNRAPASPNNSMPDISDPNSQIHTQQQVEESEYPLHPQLDQKQLQQQQFLHIHHPGTTPVPISISGYYSMYPQPHQMEQQQYPMYYFPMTQNQPLMQSNSGQPLTSPNPTLPPIYPTTQAKMETQRLVQIPNNQFQQQYMGFPQLHHPSHSISTATFAYPANDQVYYTQQPAATLSSQYQTMTASAALVVSDDSLQLSTDNKQQTRTSQPV